MAKQKISESAEQRFALSREWMRMAPKQNWTAREIADRAWTAQKSGNWNEKQLRAIHAFLDHCLSNYDPGEED